MPNNSAKDRLPYAPPVFGTMLAGVASGWAAVSTYPRALRPVVHLAESRSRGIGEMEAPPQLRLQHPVLGNQILILQLLVHGPGDVCQDACPRNKRPRPTDRQPAARARPQRGVTKDNQ